VLGAVVGGVKLCNVKGAVVGGGEKSDVRYSIRLSSLDEMKCRSRKQERHAVYVDGSRVIVVDARGIDAGDSAKDGFGSLVEEARRKRRVNARRHAMRACLVVVAAVGIAGGKVRGSALGLGW
jgi:hypothetical protein